MAECSCQIVRCCPYARKRPYPAHRTRSVGSDLGAGQIAFQQEGAEVGKRIMEKSIEITKNERDYAWSAHFLSEFSRVIHIFRHPGCRGALYMRPGAGASSAASRADMQSAPTGCGARFLRVRRAACPHAAAAACNKARLLGWKACFLRSKTEPAVILPGQERIGTSRRYGSK